MKHMKGSHIKAMNESMESAKKAHSGYMHHSDPIVGGESESEGRVMGHGEFANMPQHQVMMKAYPKANEYGPTVQDDTMGRVDKENRRSDDKARRFVSNQH